MSTPDTSVLLHISATDDNLQQGQPEKFRLPLAVFTLYNYDRSSGILYRKDFNTHLWQSNL